MKTDVINHLTEPILIPNPQTNNKVIMYIYSDAVTKCDCGKELILSQRAYGNKKYTGSCSCGLRWELLNNKIKSL